MALRRTCGSTGNMALCHFVSTIIVLLFFYWSKASVLYPFSDPSNHLHKTVLHNKMCTHHNATVGYHFDGGISNISVLLERDIIIRNERCRFKEQTIY
jgi:hypothetical protein